MDEVDIECVEDLNELEARLYAQIHHEPTSETNVGNGIQLSKNDDGFVFTDNNNEVVEPNYEVISNTNRILSKRYWANGDDVSHQQEQPQQSKHNFIRNPFKAPNNREQQRNLTQQSQRSANLSDTVINPFKRNKKQNAFVQIDKANAENSTSQADSPNVVLLSSSMNSETNQTKNVSANINVKNQDQSTEKPNLKLNPIADWMKRKKTHISKKSNAKTNNANNKNNIKQGLFARQQQKLENAKRFEDKKQRSKRAKNLAASIANKIKPFEVIDLDSENESENSDVIVIPTAPPPTFTIDDSDDDNEKYQVNMTMEHEENAVDSTDVQFSSTTASFIKPKKMCTQSLTMLDSDDRRLETNSSRCTSPCSIQSSDDFIRNIDRVRLLAGTREMADDEDLLELTSDMNTLVEPSDFSKRGNNNKCLKKSENHINCAEQEIQEENVETSDAMEFATPNTTKAQTQPKDYRVDQSQFKALDVYESESDITDSIYTKGVNKSTVIRQIDSSSDDVEDITTCSQRTKRLRKRRASSSNKEDPNIENLTSSSDNENEDDDNKVLRTSVPYIAKGVAVERYKPRKRNRTLSSCSYLQRSKSANTTGINENMSDTEFLATLNNLANGQDDEQETNNFEESEVSEAENVPTAREMAEKILTQHNANKEMNESLIEDMALPRDIVSELNEVFKTIDELDTQNSKRCSLADDNNACEISDSSGSDRETNFFYPSVPNEEAEIIKYFPNTSTANTRDKNGSPIYNVIYSRGIRKPGGFGWSDEMRKFYNDSWNGENFILSKVLQKMNPEKNLWKIYTEDRFNIKPNKRSNIKCNNCCEFGHMRSKCTRPKKPLICYMCGESGHYEPRCPNTICLRCGNKTQVFTKSCNACSYQNRLTCPICKIRGHSLDYCPDKWRRYHSTTEANVHPNNKVDYNPRRYCCICGARGHISDYCRSALRFMEYPAVTSSIKSHQKSYSDVVVRTPYNGIAVNLMYEPCQEYKLDLVDQASADKYYGRFLKAVGLDFLLKRKRHINTISTENAESSAKKAKRLSKKYEANPYLKAAAFQKKNDESMATAPNQVQEITESGNTNEEDDENNPEEVINIENKTDNELQIIDSEDEEMVEVSCDIQLNTVTQKLSVSESSDKNFKSPKVVTKLQLEPSSVQDSDSNYSFSEHFDVATSTGKEKSIMQNITILDNSQEKDEDRLVVASCSRLKSREIEALPDYIPLIDSTNDQSEQNNIIDNSTVGISRKFISAESDDEDAKISRRNLSPLPDIPSEAKIYLTHFHSKYLLSPQGNAFLVKTSRTHKLKSRLDFTSVGHVLIVFGLPCNQNKFQRELLLKYRELEDEKNEKQIQNSINVPKRTFVLIKFLRENIIQLMNNLGNVNKLLKRLQYLERQQTKSGFKLAEKVRRCLNMILVGQAGLQNGTMHLDKLLLSLKTLLNDISDDVAPPKLRLEITDHWKVIFSGYRHENYQKLVDTYNKLVSKNRLPQLNIDPLLLGQKVLDTTFTEEQKQKLEQAKISYSSHIELSKQIVAKTPKRKANTDILNTSQSPTNTNKTNTLRSDNDASCSNIRSKLTKNNTSTLQNTTKTSKNAPALSKIKVQNKTQQSSNENLTSKSTTINESYTKQPQKHTCPPPFSNPGKRSIASTIIQQEKRRRTYDTLLTEISSENPFPDTNLSGKVKDSIIPSTFWSRESMRYLDDCIRLAGGRSEVVEKLQRVNNKSKVGKLSYNDYLAVIKIHTAFNGK